MTAFSFSLRVFVFGFVVAASGSSRSGAFEQEA
jgi:hypothetical protein